VAYYDQEGRERAVVHELILPDGTIGGSGRPDPVRVDEDGTLYVSTARYIIRRG
jgi:glucose/arabinose dehydrogenase